MFTSIAQALSHLSLQLSQENYQCLTSRVSQGPPRRHAYLAVTPVRALVYLSARPPEAVSLTLSLQVGLSLVSLFLFYSLISVLEI